MMTSSMILPAEILDHVLSILREDLTSLKVCAMVSHHVRNMANPHLYREVALHNTPTSDNQISPSKMLRNLRALPHIASYVRSLHIHVDDRGVLRRMFNVLDRTYKNVTQDVASILLVLGHLESLSIISARDSLSWESLHPSFLSALLRALHSLTLTSLTIRRFKNFPVSALANCINLKHFYIIGCVDHTSNYIDESLPAKPLVRPQLESLKVIQRSFRQGGKDLLGETQWVEHLLDLSDLRSLSVWDDHKEIQQVAATLNLCANSIRKLSFCVTNTMLSVYDSDQGSQITTNSSLEFGINLSALPNLQDLTIDSVISVEEHFSTSSDGQDSILRITWQSPVPWIIRMFETLSSPFSLEHVCLKPHLEMSFLFLEQINWSWLVEIFSSERCQSIKRVDLHIWFEKSGIKNFDMALEVLERDKFLSKLRDEGLLVISDMQHVELYM